MNFVYVFILSVPGRDNFPYVTGMCFSPRKYLATIRQKHGAGCKYEVLFMYEEPEAKRIAKFLARRKKLELDYYLRQTPSQIKAWFDAIVRLAPDTSSVPVDEWTRIQINKGN